MICQVVTVLCVFIVSFTPLNNCAPVFRDEELGRERSGQGTQVVRAGAEV